MSTTPKQDKMPTRSGMRSNNNIKPPQNNSPSSRKIKVKGSSNVDNGKTQPPTTTTNEVTEETKSGYVCCICKNVESIRNSRLKMESEILADYTDKISDIKSNLNDHISQIESLDLHIQHLILNPSKLEKYDDYVSKIETKCDEIANEIKSLQDSSSNQPLTSSVPLLSDEHIIQICDKLSQSNYESHIIGNIENQLKSVDNKLLSIETLVNSANMGSNTSPPPSSTSPPEHFATPTPPQNPKPMVYNGISNPTQNIEDYKSNFICPEFCSVLSDFVKTQKAEFDHLKGRSVLSYGEPYPYNGAPKSAPKPLPEEIKRIISKIKEVYPDLDTSDINSCLLTEFSGKGSLIKEHSDDESVIRPESNIFTLTVGSPRTVVFRDLCSNSEKRLLVDNCSMYVMSRSSQDLWKHRIDPLTNLGDDGDGPDDNILRYSFTFRSIGSKFKSSTIILGDSNTKYTQFGKGKGTMGEKLPGRREATYHIEQIQPELCLGYQNIIVHVGINDIKNYKSPNISSNFNKLVEKIEHIQLLNPDASLIVSPMLPTKIISLNSVAMEFNNMLFHYNNYINQTFRVLDFQCFVNLNTNVLDDEYCCYNNKSDSIHLGRKGISKLAQLFINNLLPFRKFRDGRSYSGVTSGEKSQNSHKPDNE